MPLSAPSTCAVWRGCDQVLTLVSRSEQLRSAVSSVTIQLSLNSWYAGVSKLHQCRRDEIVNAASRYHGHSSQQQKERGRITFTAAIK